MQAASGDDEVKIPTPISKAMGTTTSKHIPVVSDADDEDADNGIYMEGSGTAEPTLTTVEGLRHLHRTCMFLI